MGGKYFYIVDKTVVGVTVPHDNASAFLFTGNPQNTEGDMRRTLYYLNEGAVVTTMAAETNSGIIVPTRRSVKDMFEFEKEEFTQAIEFYKSRMGNAPAPIDTQMAPKDSIKIPTPTNN